MATIINIEITINDSDILDDIDSVLVSFEGETREEKIKDFLNKELSNKINSKRKLQAERSITIIRNIESQ